MTTLVLEFKKMKNDDETKFSTTYSNSKAETIINESGIDDMIYWINLNYYDYIKCTKISWKRFGLNYSFSYRSYY